MFETIDFLETMVITQLPKRYAAKQAALYIFDDIKPSSVSPSRDADLST
jgi:hypothetical protein